MASSPGTSTPGQAAASVRRVLGILAVGELVLAALFFIPLFMFLTPYHELRERAELFMTSPGCQTFIPVPLGLSEPVVTPCTVEWANAVKRYSTASGSSRSVAYRYLVDVHAAHGEARTIQVIDRHVWSEIDTGDSIKLQRWGDRITAVQLISGETSSTAQNPSWQLSNDVSGLRMVGILLAFFMAIGVGCAIAYQRLPAAA
jgi:hypothetical protein